MATTMLTIDWQTALVRVDMAGSTQSLTARILGGKQNERDEWEVLVLDRLVHDPRHEEECDGWRLCGTVVTELRHVSLEDGGKGPLPLQVETFTVWPEAVGTAA